MEDLLPPGITYQVENYPHSGIKPIRKEQITLSENPYDIHILIWHFPYTKHIDILKDKERLRITEETFINILDCQVQITEKVKSCKKNQVPSYICINNDNIG